MHRGLKFLNFRHWILWLVIFNHSHVSHALKKEGLVWCKLKFISCQSRDFNTKLWYPDLSLRFDKINVTSFSDRDVLIKIRQIYNYQNVVNIQDIENIVKYKVFNNCSTYNINTSIVRKVLRSFDRRIMLFIKLVGRKDRIRKRLKVRLFKRSLFNISVNSQAYRRKFYDAKPKEYQTSKKIKTDCMLITAIARFFPYYRRSSNVNVGIKAIVKIPYVIYYIKTSNMSQYNSRNWQNHILSYCLKLCRLKKSRIHKQRKVLRLKRNIEEIGYRKPIMDLNENIQQDKTNNTEQEYIEFIEIPPYETYKYAANIANKTLNKSDKNNDEIQSSLERNRSNKQMLRTFQTLHWDQKESAEKGILEINNKESAIDIQITGTPISVQLTTGIEPDIRKHQEFAQTEQNGDLKMNISARNTSTSDFKDYIYDYANFTPTTKNIEFDDEHVHSELMFKNTHPFISDHKQVIELLNQSESVQLADTFSMNRIMPTQSSDLGFYAVLNITGIDLKNRLENIELMLSRLEEKLDGVINFYKSAINISDIWEKNLKQLSSRKVLPPLVSEQENLIEQLKTILSETESLNDWHFEMVNPEDVPQLDKHFEQMDQTQQPDFPTSSTKNSLNRMDYDKNLIQSKPGINSSVNSSIQENVHKPFTLDHLIPYIESILKDNETWAAINNLESNNFNIKPSRNLNYTQEIQEKSTTQDAIINQQSWISNESVIPSNYLQSVISSEQEDFYKNKLFAQEYPDTMTELVQKLRPTFNYINNSKTNFALETPKITLQKNVEVSNASGTRMKEELFTNAKLFVQSTPNLINESLFKTYTNTNTNLNNIMSNYPFGSEGKFNRRTPLVPVLFVTHDMDDFIKSTTTSAILLKNLISPVVAENKIYDEEVSYMMLLQNMKTRVLPHKWSDLFNPVNLQNIQAQDKERPMKFEQDNLRKYLTILGLRPASRGTRN